MPNNKQQHLNLWVKEQECERRPYLWCRCVGPAESWEGRTDTEKIPQHPGLNKHKVASGPPLKEFEIYGSLKIIKQKQNPHSAYLLTILTQASLLATQNKNHVPFRT